MKVSDSHLLVLALLFLPVTLTSTAQDKPATPPDIPTSFPASARRDVGGSYWHIDGNFDSILHIKNVLETSKLTVTPVLWMADGTEYDLSPITLNKAESVSINITHAIADAPPAISRHASQFGSAGIRYSWNWRDAAVAHVSITDEVNSLTYVTHASAAVAPNSEVASSAMKQNILEGLWWLQTANVLPFVTLVNTSSAAIPTHIALSNAKGDSSNSMDVVVPAGQSQMIQLSHLISGLSGSAKEGGLQVSYTGHPGSLVIEGGLQDFDAGYSAPIPMLSLESRKMRGLVSPNLVTLASVGVQIGNPAPQMQFPQDTSFVPYTFIRNISDSPIRVTLAASYMSSGPQKLQLGSIVINGKQALNLQLEDLLNRTVLAGYSGDANLIFSFEGQAGDLLVATGSTGKDSTYVFAVDPMIVVPETGKIFCEWEVFGSTDTMLSFWNSGAVAEDAELFLFFTGGHYRLPIHLAASESRTINLASLINSRVPDADGNTIPRTAVEGSARLTNPLGRRTPMDIKANAAIFNVQTATCREPCPLCDDVTSAYVTPAQGEVAIGANLSYTTTATTKTGETFNATSSTTWSSSNTGIATISTAGMATGVSLGSTNINAVYVDTGVPSWKDGSLCNYPSPNCPRFIIQPVQPIITTPDRMIFFSDYSGNSSVRSSSCPANATYAAMRVIQYQVFAGTQPAGSVPMQESFVFGQHSSCTTASDPSPTICNSQGVSSIGVFNDFISTNACVPPDSYSCGWSLTPDHWQYCPSGKPAVTVGSPTYVVTESSVSVDGSTASQTIGSTVPK